MRTRLPLLLLVPLMIAAGCSRTATFANRTDGPVVVSVALVDADGDQDQVVGAIVDAGRELEITYQPGGEARASIWKGELQRGEPAAVVGLNQAHLKMDLREEDGRLVVGPAAQ